jgi:hypothetical protein
MGANIRYDFGNFTATASLLMSSERTILGPPSDDAFAPQADILAAAIKPPGST